MKIAIILGICLLVIVLLVANFTRLVGGISKQHATTNLEAYLKIKYQDEVRYKWLKRFFNSGNMDPNMFTVLFYNTDTPEIEFYCHINLKTILEDNAVTSGDTEQSTINARYLAATKRYDTRQAIKRLFKTECPTITFNTNTIDLSLEANLEPDALQELIKRFIVRLNYFYEDLGIYTDIAIVIKTPEHPDGFLEVPLELFDSKWHSGSFMLSEKASGLKTVETSILKKVNQYLRQSQPNFKIYNAQKIFLDKTTFSRAAWVHYLSDTTIVNGGNTKWQNPLKGVYVTYFDFETHHIYKGDLLTSNYDTLSYDETLVQLKGALQTEGVLAW